MLHLSSSAIAYASQLGLALSFAALIFAFRQAIGRYFRAVMVRQADPAAGSSRELILIGLALGGLVTLVLLVIGLPAFVGLIAGAVTTMVAPSVVKKRRRVRYIKDFDAALAESLQTVASSLKAGLTLKDSLYVAADNSAPAFANEVARALKQYHFGVPIEQALDNVRQRIQTPNANIAFGSMIISSRLGGRLPDMLKQIVKTIRERERVEGKLQALTAQGRAQAALLCAAPPALGIGMYLYDKQKMALLTDFWVGQILLCIAITLELVGIFVTSRVLKLEV